MAEVQRDFEDIIGDGIEGDYWKPESIGESIEGTVIEFDTSGDYGEQLVLQLEDERMITLPSNKDLQNKQKFLYLNEFVKISLDKIVKSNNPRYNDKKIFRIQRDKNTIQREE